MNAATIPLPVCAFALLSTALAACGQLDGSAPKAEDPRLDPPSSPAAMTAAARARLDSLSDAARVHDLAGLHDALASCPEDAGRDEFAAACPRIVYVRSSGMPLSDAAIPEITLATSAMGVPLTIVSADALIQGDGTLARDIRTLRSALIAAGATVHYPSVTVFRGGSPYGTAVAGYKRAQGYRAVLEPRLASVASGVAPGPARLADGSAELPRAEPGGIEIVWRQTMTPAPGFFFRRAPGTRFISYDQRSRVILQHLETGEKLRGPGFIDFVPTPDGALFVTPSHADGLEFHVASRVFSEARAGRGADVEPVFRDPQLDDQYPSVGVIEDDPGVRTTYRVLVSWFEGLAVRDYRVEWGGAGAAQVTPITPRIDACPGLHLSTPILSKDGTEIVARDEVSGTTKLFSYSSDGTCDEEFDFGIATSKVSFSNDGRRIAYSTPEGTTGTSRVYVLDRADGRVVRLPESESRGLTIPEFIGPDSVLFLVAGENSRGASEFRIACCVR